MDNYLPGPKGKRRLEVVIVDNDLPHLGELTSAIAAMGWWVQPFSDPYEALKYILDVGDGVHTLIVELSTPGSFSGLELALMIEKRDSKIRVIATSEVLQAAFQLSPNVIFVMKPWPVTAVVDLLGNPRQRSIGNDEG